MADLCIGMESKLGVANGARVFALWDYEAQSGDELTLRVNDALQVIQRDSDADSEPPAEAIEAPSPETEWWLARHLSSGRLGLVPRPLLGLYPRVLASSTHSPKRN